MLSWLRETTQNKQEQRARRDGARPKRRETSSYLAYLNRSGKSVRIIQIESVKEYRTIRMVLLLPKLRMVLHINSSDSLFSSGLQTS